MQLIESKEVAGKFRNWYELDEEFQANDFLNMAEYIKNSGIIINKISLLGDGDHGYGGYYRKYNDDEYNYFKAVFPIGGENISQFIAKCSINDSNRFNFIADTEDNQIFTDQEKTDINLAPLVSGIEKMLQQKKTAEASNKKI